MSVFHFDVRFNVTAKGKPLVRFQIANIFMEQFVSIVQIIMLNNANFTFPFNIIALAHEVLYVTINLFN